MFYTYILKSQKQPGAIYIGHTTDLKRRFAQHNSPTSMNYSNRHAPWVLETYLAFSDLFEAKAFECYLKSSSGKAFMKKRLISKDFNKLLSNYKNGRSTE